MNLIEKEIKDLENTISKDISKIELSIGQVKKDIQVISDNLKRLLNSQEIFVRNFCNRLKNQILIKLENQLYPQCQTIFLQLQKAIKQNISQEEIQQLSNKLKDNRKNFLSLVTNAMETVEQWRIRSIWQPYRRQIEILRSKLDNIRNVFQSTNPIIKCLISLVKVLKQKKQEQKEVKKKLFLQQLLASITQLQTSITQLQTSNQPQIQQIHSIISQQQTTIQSQHEQINQRSQQLQSQSQELVALSEELALTKKLLQETILRNSQQTTKIIQENEAMKKQLEERDQQIQRLNEEVGFLGSATKTEQQVNPSNELLQKILKELQYMRNDQISTITKKNHELQTQKLLLQAKLKQQQRPIPKDSEDNLENKCDVNIKQLKQDIVKGLDKLQEMKDSTEKYDKVVSELNDEIIQLKGKIYLQDKTIAQLQQSLKQCQSESIKTRKSHQLELKRSSLQHQAEVEKVASLSNLLQQRQRQCESLRHQLSVKSKEVINLKIENQRLQSQLDEGA